MNNNNFIGVGYSIIDKDGKSRYLLGYLKNFDGDNFQMSITHANELHTHKTISISTARKHKLLMLPNEYFTRKTIKRIHKKYSNKRIFEDTMDYIVENYSNRSGYTTKEYRKAVKNFYLFIGKIKHYAK